MALPFGAVAVELGVREVDRKSLGGVDRRQRRLDVAGDAELVAVDVERVRHAEARDGARETVRRILRGVTPW